ncbi:MAG: CatB-related O-acetyltransferase [Planctomycetes bacterium]|nr:CatB-related O-acetyltransferase [Planctomycetota bacterium]
MFFHPAFGAVAKDLSSRTQLVVGNDVWISNFAVVLPSVRSIGDGAVIGAGAVVGRDVPPYAIVHGNPARVIGYRFDEARIQELLAERWWDRPLDELLREPQRFTVPLVLPSAPA